jgi:glutathione S-transferase
MTEWRKIEELKRSPIRHRRLPPALVARIAAICSTLDEVYPKSMTEWLDGFQRDENPEAEVVWWERVAHVYQEYSQREELNVGQRQPAFRIIMKLALGSTQELTEDLADLPATALDEILEAIRRTGAVKN